MLDDTHRGAFEVKIELTPGSGCLPSTIKGIVGGFNGATSSDIAFKHTDDGFVFSGSSYDTFKAILPEILERGYYGDGVVITKSFQYEHAL